MSAGKAVALVVGGALLGAGVTTLVLKKKYAAQAEEEITSVRDSYLKRITDLEDLLNKQEEKVSAPPVGVTRAASEVPMERVVPTNETLRKAYHKMAPSPETVEGLKETVEGLGYSRKEEHVKEPLVKVVATEPTAMAYRESTDPDVPYIIPVQAYMDNEELNEQLTLTYYVGDKTLVVEDSDEVVEDVDQTVGFNNLHNLGVESGNDDTVYVRNEKRAIEYEILRDEGKYHEAVQGVDTWGDSPEPREPIRKFR
jgi:hypothetical protein